MITFIAICVAILTGLALGAVGLFFGIIILANRMKRENADIGAW